MPPGTDVMSCSSFVVEFLVLGCYFIVIKLPIKGKSRVQLGPRSKENENRQLLKEELQH